MFWSKNNCFSVLFPIASCAILEEMLALEGLSRNGTPLKSFPVDPLTAAATSTPLKILDVQLSNRRDRDEAGRPVESPANPSTKHMLITHATWAMNVLHKLHRFDIPFGTTPQPNRNLPTLELSHFPCNHICENHE